jgi:hypothetical protein
MQIFRFWKAESLSANVAMLLRGVDRLAEFLALRDAEVLVAAQLMPDFDSQDRLSFVLDRIGQLIAAGRK